MGGGGTSPGPATAEGEDGKGGGGRTAGPTAATQIAQAKMTAAQALWKLIEIDMNNTPVETLYRKGNPKVGRCIQLK